MPSLIWRSSAAVTAPCSCSRFSAHASPPVRRRADPGPPATPPRSRLLLPQHHQEGHHLKVVDPGEFTRQSVGASGRKQARHRPLLALAHHGGHRCRQQPPGLAHVFPLARSPIESGACAGIHLIAPLAGGLEPVQDSLGLRGGQQDRAFLRHVHQVVGSQRGAAVADALTGLALRPQAEHDPCWTRHLRAAHHRKQARGQPLDSAGMGPL